MTRSAAKFNCADLRDVISGTSAIVKKEKGIPAIPMVPASTPSKLTGSGKKRKALEILDLTLDDSNPADVMHKLSVMVDTVSVRLILFFFSFRFMILNLLFRPPLKSPSLLRRRRRNLKRLRWSGRRISRSMRGFFVSLFKS